jgi:uncharacterized protein DUF1902
MKGVFMIKRTFAITALWDEEAKVYYSESEIIGLHIEADTIDEFERLMFEFAPDLIIANHISKPELQRRKIQDLIPAILWQRPDPALQSA